MRICVVADNIKPNAGLGRMVTSISSGLEKKGHSIGFVVCEGDSTNPVLKISFRFTFKYIFRTLVDLYKMRNFLKDYDAVVCFDVLPSGILAHVATIGRSDKIIVHSLGTYSLFFKSKGLRKKIKLELMKYVYINSERIWLINDFVKRKIKQSNTSFDFVDNVSMVSVGVDTSLFHKKTKPTYKHANEYIISVGAVKPRKGQLDSIMAFNVIKNKYPKLKYLVVGSISDSPAYYEQILEYIKLNNIKDRVIFVQNVSDAELIDMYSGARFFVLTPRSSHDSIEGFGMVYIEAALCGLTSIGTLDTGAEAAINANESGLLVNQGDVVQIAGAMEKLLLDAPLRDKFVNNSYNNALRYDWKHVVDLYEKELSNLI